MYTRQQKIVIIKKKITVFGNTNFKNKFNLRYINIELKKDLFSSQTKIYVKNDEGEIEITNVSLRLELLKFLTLVPIPE